MSRARKLFQYVDLQGSTVPSPASNEGRVSSSMSSNGDATVREQDYKTFLRHGFILIHHIHNYLHWLFAQLPWFHDSLYLCRDISR